MLVRTVKRLFHRLGLHVGRRGETLLIPRPKPGPGHFACTHLDWNEAAVDASFQDLAPWVDEMLEALDRGEIRYDPSNTFFGLADAAIAYAQVRHHRPETIVEVGSGHSSYVLRHALDRNGSGRLISIDPDPRIEVAAVVDESIRARVESIPGADIADRVGQGLLFIDSSHVVATGNDVTHLFLETLPHLRAGTLVHVHDIYLPEDYPVSWNIGKGFNYSEQYLLHAFLCFNRSFQVAWPGRWVLHHRRDQLQQLVKTAQGLEAHCSFWFRRGDDRAQSEATQSAP